MKRDGFIERYQNGANQSGLKKSVAADLYNQSGKSLTTYIKLLRDILPPGTAGGDALEVWKNKNGI